MFRFVDAGCQITPDVLVIEAQVISEARNWLAILIVSPWAVCIRQLRPAFPGIGNSSYRIHRSSQTYSIDFEMSDAFIAYNVDEAAALTTRSSSPQKVRRSRINDLRAN